jgi:hypothetical protein
LAGGPFGYRERSEALDRDLLAAPESRRDRVKDGIKRLVGGALGQAGAVGDVGG